MGDPPQPPSAQPALPKAAVPAWLWAVLGAAGVVIIVLAVTVFLLLSRDHDSNSETKATEAAKTMAVAGTLTLTSADVQWDTDGSCYGTEGYDDISSGVQVVVRNGAGETVGVGALDPGKKLSSVQCEFHFMVPNVPAGLGIYSVEISHRGEISFPEANAQQLSLTLG